MKSPPKPKPSKQLDLQGIRALAIIVVLGFHFFPDYCPNGYLGVDQFFVLSGFLMCMLLKRAENQTPYQLITIFYSKRFKRILPLYLLVILVSMISLYSFFPDTAIETNQESAVQALLFMSNRPKTDQEDYFQALSLAVDIFTHTWSLSVEIQFYFLVPFIFLLSTKIPQRLQHFYYSILGSLSFLHFYTSSETASFNSVFARVWQFLIGMAVYLLSSSESSEGYKSLQDSEDIENLLEDTVQVEDQHRVRKLAYILLSSMGLITLFPTVLLPVVVRPLITIGTGALMLISKDNLILSNKILVYIGDISYSLYLIHWPIYAYWKLTCDGDSYKLLGALVFSLFLAILTFETFEKWYLQISSTSVGLLIVLLFSLNAIVINRDDLMDLLNGGDTSFARLDGVTGNVTLDEAARLNLDWSSHDGKLLRVPTCDYETKSQMGWCSHRGLSPSGKYKLALIGNSWAANHATMIYQECGKRVHRLLQGSAKGCEPLYPTVFPESEILTQNCQKNFTDYEERIRVEKPDYMFLLTRFFSTANPMPQNVTNLQDDPTYKIMKTQLFKFLPNIKHKVYILDSLPRHRRKILEIVPWMKKGVSMGRIDNLLIKPDNFELSRKRHAQLVKDCGSKCILVDYKPEFFNKTTNTYRYYDERGISYWTQGLHLSPHGIEHVRHVWRRICEEL